MFFFDDNINLHLGNVAGAPDTKGICNLRDIYTGAYVDFSIGSNGFSLERAHRHTLIHHSSKYRAVLVQVNILEAMSNDDYFTSIIDKYAKEGEKLIVYMDVNGTILWSDSIMGLGPSELLLEAMLALSVVHPSEPFIIRWEENPEVKVREPTVVKQLMHDISGHDKTIFHSFLVLDKACELLRKLEGHNAKLFWNNGPEFIIEEFVAAYEGYVRQLRKQGSSREHHGITNSWFRCLRQLQDGGHTAVINSFGMDTQKVVVRSVADSQSVMHVAVNFEMWTERDASKYAAQFKEAMDSLTPTASPKRGGASHGFPGLTQTASSSSSTAPPGGSGSMPNGVGTGGPSSCSCTDTAFSGCPVNGQDANVPGPYDDVMMRTGSDNSWPCSPTKRPPPEPQDERGRRSPASGKTAQEVRFMPPPRAVPAKAAGPPGAREAERERVGTTICLPGGCEA